MTTAATALTPPVYHFRPRLVSILAHYAVLGCLAFIISIFIADFVVPDHDWVADTISDLGAGRYEFIVDIGLYAYSAALISLAVAGAHLHLGGMRWSFGVIGLVMLGLLVFLVGARNEYGDGDNEGVVIHIYLVYAIGVLMTAIPLLLQHGARHINENTSRCFIGIAALWTISAPIFFFLPTSIDGLYERYLGLIALVFTYLLARLLLAACQTQDRSPG